MATGLVGTVKKPPVKTPAQLAANPPLVNPMNTPANQVKAASNAPTPNLPIPKIGDVNQWNVTADQTVAGQVANNLRSGSELNQLSETQGLQTAAQRGLANSSLAVGEAQNAVIKNVLPIATQDADTFGRAAAYGAQTANDFQKQDAQNHFAQNQQNIALTNANRQNTADRLLQMQQTGATQQFTREQDLFSANVQATLDQINNQFKSDMQSQQLYAGLYDTFQKSMTQINQDTNMNQKSKDYALKQAANGLKAAISVLSAVGSVPDVSTLLDFGTTAPKTKEKTKITDFTAAQQSQAQAKAGALWAKLTPDGKLKYMQDMFK